MYYPREYLSYVVNGDKFEREGNVLMKEVRSLNDLSEVVVFQKDESLRKKDVTGRVYGLLESGKGIVLNYDLESGYFYIFYEGRRVLVYRGQNFCTIPQVVVEIPIVEYHRRLAENPLFEIQNIPSFD